MPAEAPPTLRLVRRGLGPGQPGFAALLDQIPQAIGWIDSQSIVVAGNSALRDLLGYKTDEKPAIAEFFETRKCPWPRTAAHSSESIRSSHYEIRNRDGRRFSVTLRVRSLRTAEGHLDLVAFQNNDEFPAHQRACARQDRLNTFGHFAGGIANELNNALTPIVLGLDLLRPEVWTAERLLIDRIASCAQDASAIASELLLFARRTPMVLKPEDPASILLGVGHDVARSLPQSITLSIAQEGGVPKIQCDRDSLSRALLTLAQHGRKAVTAGGQLSIRTDSVSLKQNELDAEMPPCSGRFVRVLMSDSASWVAADSHTRLLGPYFGANETNETGWIGLSAALGIVEGHGGFVVKVSAADGRSRGFAVFLPVDTTPGSPACTTYEK